MKIHWVGLIVMAVLCIAMDVYICRRLSRNGYRVATWLNALLAVLAAGLVIAIGVLPMSSAAMSNSAFVTCQYMLYTFFALLAPKALGMMVYGIGRWMKRRWAALCAFIVAALVFGVMWWGAIVTPGTLEVKEVELEFANLPDAFDGYRIVQWSDAHLGTYNGRTAIVEKQIKAINDLKADIICFTGDLVSRETSEALPYKKDLSKLHAPDGVISILGNHDDTHYKDWPTQQQRDADFKALIDLQREMGWKLLINDHIILRRDSAEIAVVGTKSFQGWPFPRYAYLDTAYADYDKSKRFMILLQHNPEQWKLDSFYQRRITMVRPADKADLMLSGHTHAMQCMITLFGHKITPASLFNDYAVGLYTEGDHKLYTNIGIGLVGIPARLGTAYPEITIITLKKRGPCIVNQNGWKIAD